MTRIFAPAPHRNIPDATVALQQLEQLLAEAGERLAPALDALPPLALELEPAGPLVHVLVDLGRDVEPLV